MGAVNINEAIVSIFILIAVALAAKPGIKWLLGKLYDLFIAHKYD